MSKRTLEHKHQVSLHQNPAKRQKTSHNNTKHERKWSAMELYCIMELIVHEDVRKFYTINPDLDASLFNTQDWHEISDWMSSYFSKSQPFWFANHTKPKTPYNPQEIKKCAINIIAKHNDGILPKKFDKLSAICHKTKKIFNQNAIKILDKNTITLSAKLKQTKSKLKTPKNSAIINKIPPIPLPIITQQKAAIKHVHVPVSRPTKQIKQIKQIKHVNTAQNTIMNVKSQAKSDENTCKGHLMLMLKKLSQYNDKTQATMRKKLEDKFSKQFAQVQRDCGGSALKLKTDEKKLLQQKDKDWQQYKHTIANKVRGSWQENVIKLQNKFSNIIDNVIPRVQKEYLQQNPNDETIKLLFATQKMSKVVKNVNGNSMVGKQYYKK